ncbi:Heterokaryon incompatibility protein 6, OR allele [Madurella mycetomatis]|uniref:Heterokaryon incompatibility protein 6, OR allele n=1 Tax=Madurella mycetomatis TaxID=100816 RepID=A0A175VVX9_9PEZI|nr:Heterokaryon incompatibility protein 6, OR allele [Madurella mycetomatis]
MRDVAPDEHKEWTVLRALFRKQYWERLWVVQEVTSSTVAVVLWCDVEIPWTWVGITACLIRHSHEKSTSMIDEADLRGVHNACLMFLLPDEEWASTPFLHLMRVLLRFKVTNQHDRAYAILGLPGLHTGGTSVGLFVQPDYGLSLHELYLSLAERIVDTHENPLDLLSAVKHDHVIDHSLPSWVPRWNVTVVRSINGSHRTGMRFHAGGISPPPIRPSCHRRPTDGRLLLTAPGRIIGTVAKVAALSTGLLAEGPGRASGWGPAAQLLYQWQGVGPNEVDMDQSTMRAICMIITAGQDWYGRLIDTGEAERQHLADFGAFASSTWKRPWNRTPQAEHKPCGERFALAVRNVCQQRSIFQARDGSLGIGSTAIRPRDIICVLQGGSVPYVLRSALDRIAPRGYWLVGECYLDGHMFGEALESYEPDGTDATWDTITLL